MRRETVLPHNAVFSLIVLMFVVAFSLPFPLHFVSLSNGIPAGKVQPEIPRKPWLCHANPHLSLLKPFVAKSLGCAG